LKAKATGIRIKYLRMNTRPHVPVCMPRAAPRPRRVRKRTKGNSPMGGAALFLSVAATIMNAKTAAPRNSEKKHVAALI